MAKKAWKKSVLLGLMLVIVVGGHSARPQDTVRHQGNLIIDGDEVFTIEGITYCQRGNIYVRDSAKLVIKGGVLLLDQRYHYEYEIRLDGHSTLIMENSSIDSEYQFVIRLSDNSNGQIERSNIAAINTITLNRNSSLHVSSSILGTLVLEQWGPGTEPADFVTLIVESSSILHGIELVVAFSPTMVLRSLASGQYDDWDLTRDNEAHNLPMNVRLIDTNVRSWNFEFGGTANITFEDCDIGHLRARGLSDITVTNSTVDLLGLYFDHNQIVEVRGLKPGHLTDWTLRNLSENLTTRQSFVLENTQVNGWEIINEDSVLTIVDSEIDVLWTASGETTIRNSLIGTFFLHHGGTEVFEDAIVQSVDIFAHTRDQLSGTARFLDKELHGPWHDSIIPREFPVIVQTASGSPVPNVHLELFSSQGELIWSGKSDSGGKATFEIVFDDDNHDEAWTLRAPALGIARVVRFLTDTPIVIEQAR